LAKAALSIPGGLVAAIAAAARYGPNKLARTNLLIQTLILLSYDGATSMALSERGNYDASGRTLILGRK
jgi:hypothetical protein